MVLIPPGFLVSLVTAGKKTATDVAVSLLGFQAVRRSFVETFRAFVSFQFGRTKLHILLSFAVEQQEKVCKDSLGDERDEGEKWKDGNDV